MGIWEDLRKPSDGELTLRLIETKSVFNWSWAKNCEGHTGFVIELSSMEHEISNFEQTKELTVSLTEFNGIPMLGVFCISEEGQRPSEELFQDLINKTSHINNEFELFNHLRARYNAWCSLFKATRQKLKDNEILGLAAELTFLRLWVKNLGENIEHWVGPLKKHQDFISEKNKRAVEIKLGRWDPESVSISSLEQLDFDGDLSLLVYPGKMSDKNESSAISIPMIVEQLEAILTPEESLVLTNRLMVLGYDQKECEDKYFEIGSPIIFKVSDDFPKLTRGNTPADISKCSYSLSLSDIGHFKTDIQNI